jgi:hypothetical protein
MKPVDLVTIPSGMGGTFDVIRLKETRPGLWVVRVHSPKNPDWHGYELLAHQSDMREPDTNKPYRELKPLPA